MFRRRRTVLVSALLLGLIVQFQGIFGRQGDSQEEGEEEGEASCGSGTMEDNMQLSADSMNQHVVNAEYAVRGPILLRALEIQKDLDQGVGNYPFDRIVKCNIGNPQALGQKPITFSRQVLSLVMNPELLDLPNIEEIYAPDVIARANVYLNDIKSVGAYSESQGVTTVRKEVAAFLEERDNIPADDKLIFLSAGASQAVQQLLTLLIRSADDAVLVPIPQYPLYSALTTLLGGHMAGYLLGEQTGWDLDLGEIEKSLETAKSLGKTVRALVVINPGNPTGSTMPVEQMKTLIEFCARENLVLLADEVYQTNVYRDDRPFVSFRAVLHQMGYLDDKGELAIPFQLASFHSVSKGVIGECGLRGGFVELIGFSAAVRAQIYKMASIGLCSNVPGQLAVGLMVNPPKPGQPSFELYHKEKDAIYDSLKRRAAKLEKALNSMPGVVCNPIEGAMYAFPQLSLPSKFVDAKLSEGVQPDVAYAIDLLNNTGLVVVPGSGFGQRKDTYHIRTTFLPPEEVMDQVLSKFAEFHAKFMKNWA